MIMNRRGWFLAFAMTTLFAWSASAHEGKVHDADHKPCCTPGSKGACCSKDAKAGECCKGKDCCKGKECCEHAADHVTKPCCTPGTPGACCPVGAKFGECCKGKDCCKDKGDH